jgi:hypothetical protein
MVRYRVEIRKVSERDNIVARTAGRLRMARGKKMAERRETRGPSPYFIKDSLCSSSLSTHISLTRDLHQSGKYCIRAGGLTVGIGGLKLFLGFSV